MKTDTNSEWVNRYKAAEAQVWAKLENWQKLAISQDRKEKKQSSIFDTFSKQVIALAESKDFSPKIEPVPSKKY